MTVYVLSTMTNSVSYVNYNYVGETNESKGVGPLPIVRDKVTIFGGAGIPSAKSGFGERATDAEGSPIWTAAGMVTPVSDEKFDLLKGHWLFRKHQDGGYVKVLNKDIRGDYNAIKKEVRTMSQNDGAAQLTPSTLNMRVKVKTAELDQNGEFRL